MKGWVLITLFDKSGDILTDWEIVQIEGDNAQTRFAASFSAGERIWSIDEQQQIDGAYRVRCFPIEPEHLLLPGAHPFNFLARIGRVYQKAHSRTQLKVLMQEALSVP